MNAATDRRDHAVFRYLVVLAFITPLACAEKESRRADSQRGGEARVETLTRPDSAPPPLPASPQSNWQEYHADGFTLRYPNEAVLAADSSHPMRIAGTAIRGPVVAVRSRSADIGTHTGPAYQLIVSSSPNPGGTLVDAWVDSVRAARNREIGDDPDSTMYFTPPDTARVGAERALVLQPPCGDCQAEEFYIVSPRRRVLISILYDLSIPGDHEAQKRLYDAVLSTFRWQP